MKLGPYEIRFSPPSVNLDGPQHYADFSGTYQFVQAMLKAGNWILGDLLNLGDQFGESASQVMDGDHKKASQAKFTASVIKPESRREGVSWSHHVEVAKVPCEDKREALLMWCVSEQPTVAELKKRIRGEESDELWDVTHARKKLRENVERVRDKSEPFDVADELRRIAESLS